MKFVYRSMKSGRCGPGLLAIIRDWWFRYTGEEDCPLDGDTPAWFVSMAVHVAVLLSLSVLVVQAERATSRPIVLTAEDPVVEELDENPLPEEFVVAQDESEAGAKSEAGDEAAQAVAPLLSDISVTPVQIEEIASDEVRIDEPSSEVVPAGLELNENLSIRGDVAVGTTGASGAVDRLTAEIKASLDQRPTLVVWVFDQSVSLAGQRREIASRLDRVFEEVGAFNHGQGGPDLTNMVFAYGKQVFPVVVRPTRDSSEVVEAIESIPVDESGVEMTFGAVAEAAASAKGARAGSPRRNVMIIVFTDEVGNDQSLADDVATVCRRQSMQVYVVGVPAPFGRRQVQVRFVEYDSRYASEDQYPVVDQGPETLYPEVVQIRSGKESDEPMDSGFGPYGLSKLCAETGGIYFCVHANRSTAGRVGETAPMASRLHFFFDHDVMRKYRPDYLSIAKTDQLILSNRAKRALVEAARSSELNPMASPKMTFPREDEGRLANLISEAQKAAAVLSPKVDALYAILLAGQTDREKIDPSEQRWQAGYDLAMGRVMAAKVRVDAYNIMLAQAKTGMKFKNPKSDTWRLVPSDAVEGVGSQTEKIATQARVYLERVVRDHPGTPWSMIAAEELGIPFGYSWEEAYTGVNAPRPGGGGGSPNPVDDKPRNLAPPKPKRQLKNL